MKSIRIVARLLMPVGVSLALVLVAFAPGDPQRAYAVTNNGRLYFSTDHGLSWQASASSAPGQHYFYGTAIAVNPDDVLDAVV